MKLRCLVPLVLALCLTAAAASPHTIPDLSLKDIDGQRQKLSALRGSIVVLSFWATWCGPCQQELPRLSHLNAAYAGKPVRFIAVSIDDAKSRDQLAQFLAQRDIHLLVWTGATTDTMASVGLADIVPSTIILDPEGRSVTRITGEAQEDDIRRSVDWLLTNRPEPAPPTTLRRMAFPHVLVGHSVTVV